MRLVNTVLMERVVEWDKKLSTMTARTKERLQKILELPHVKAINLDLSRNYKLKLKEKDICSLIEISGHLLKLLNLSDTKFSGNGLSGSTLQLEKLETLDLSCCTKLTDSGFRALLEKCGQRLNSLNLGSTNVTGESLVDSNLQLNNLKTLKLHGCSQLTGSGFRALLEKCGQRLNSLNLGNTNVTGESLVESNLQLNNLETLNLIQCKQLTDSGFRALLEICGQSLNSLDLGSTNVTGTLLVDWMEQRPRLQLRKITLYGCDNVTATDVARLSAVLPNCEIRY